MTFFSGGDIDFSKLYLWNLDQEKKEQTGFHMPGHNRGAFFGNEYKKRILSLDTTELSCSEDLHHPGARLSLLMEKTARLQKSGASFFLTTGSTTGIHAMIGAVLSKKSFFLLPRNVHMSVLSVFSMLHCRYEFISFENGSGEPLSPKALEAALKKYPQATDVFLVSPDYFGRVAEVEALSSVCHKNGCRLLVDEAHGAHFSFACDIFPKSAMSSGADISVQSIHKTMPAFTMTALLHIGREALSENRVSKDRVCMALSLFETSSPSLLLAASSEYAIAWMEKNAKETYGNMKPFLEDFVEQIEAIMGTQSLMRMSHEKKDFSRLVLDTKKWNIPAFLIHRELEKRGIFPEFSDFSRLVFILSPWQKKEDFAALLSALLDISKNLRNGRGESEPFEDLWENAFSLLPIREKTLYAATFEEETSYFCRLKDAEGKVATKAIIPYPPGIPLIWPGEVVQRAHILFLQKMIHHGLTVLGMKDGNICVF